MSISKEAWLRRADDRELARLKRDEDPRPYLRALSRTGKKPDLETRHLCIEFLRELSVPAGFDFLVELWNLWEDHTASGSLFSLASMGHSIELLRGLQNRLALLPPNWMRGRARGALEGAEGYVAEFIQNTVSTPPKSTSNLEYRKLPMALYYAEQDIESMEKARTGEPP